MSFYRSVIQGLALTVCLVGSAVANAPMVSERPVARPGSTPPPSLERIIDSTRFDGDLGVALVDVATGTIIEARNAEQAFAPASVTKAITAMYALDKLGENFRFVTTVGMVGTQQGSVLDGDLVLIGTGDPTLDTDDLIGLADQIKAAGITSVTGRLSYYDGALPRLREIDDQQPSYVGYNPAISGLNLNYNRVYFEWKRQGSGFETSVDARSDIMRPKVSMARVGISDRAGPVFTYENRDGVDAWNVRQSALGNGGGRWLPVRDAGRYTADVFVQVLRARAVSVSRTDRIAQIPPVYILAKHDSAPVVSLVQDMLKYSTNLTAEVLGLRSSLQERQVESLAASAALMQDWSAQRLGMQAARFVDHSGLGDQTRVSPLDMVRALRAKHLNDPRFVDVLKPIPVRDAKGTVQGAAEYSIQAKTGTLNFVSTLAGYLVGPDAKTFAFVIFGQNMDQRMKTMDPLVEQPKGSKTFNIRAKVLQRHLLARWAQLPEVFGQ